MPQPKATATNTQSSSVRHDNEARPAGGSVSEKRQLDGQRKWGNHAGNDDRSSRPAMITSTGSTAKSAAEQELSRFDTDSAKRLIGGSQPDAIVLPEELRSAIPTGFSNSAAAYGTDHGKSKYPKGKSSSASNDKTLPKVSSGPPSLGKSENDSQAPPRQSNFTAAAGSEVSHYDASLAKDTSSPRSTGRSTQSTTDTAFPGEYHVSSELSKLSRHKAYEEGDERSVFESTDEILMGRAHDNPNTKCCCCCCCSC